MTTDHASPASPPRADHGRAGRAAAPRVRAPSIERALPWIVGLAYATPVLVAAYPPMTDLPFHEAGVGILRHLHDPTMFPPGLYFVNLGEPNQLFHLASFVLSYALGIVLAVKVVVAAAVVAVPVGAARLAAHLGASRWTALLVAPLALGWLFFTGLVANLLGLGALLLVLPTLDAFVERPTGLGAVKAIAAALLLYFAHEAMLIDYGGAALLFTLAHRPRLRETALRLGVFAGCVSITLAHLALQRPLMTKSVASTKTVFLPVWLKVPALPRILYGNYDVAAAWIVFAISIATLLLLAAQRARQRLRRDPVDAPAARGLRRFVHAWRFELFTAGLYACYFAFPVTLVGATYVHQRFLPPAFALTAVLASPRGLPAAATAAAPDARAPRLPLVTRALASVVPIALLLAIWPAFVDQTRNFHDLEKLIRRVAPGSAMASMGIRDPSQGFVQTTLAVHALTERGGRMLYSFAESPIAPVMIRPEWEWAEPIARVVHDEGAFCPAYDLTRFRYVFVHTAEPQMAYVVTRALHPQARLVDVAGGWALYESQLPTVPLESPDRAAPSPCPDGALRERMARELEAVQKLIDRLPPEKRPSAPPAGLPERGVE